MTAFFKAKVQGILARANVQIGGARPWDIVVHDERLYRRVLFGGSLAFGEAYMDGWWDAECLDEFFTRVIRNGLNRYGGRSQEAWRTLLHRLINRQSLRRAFVVGERHYDIGNELYEAMLDTRLTYTCGYWSGVPQARDLDEAQVQKLDLICRKLNLRPGQRVLDIGCGWGSFAKFAAERYGVAVTGVTISQEQVALARKLCQGLPVEIILEDYRKTRGQFDHVVSVGMFEHVGYKNYRTYMEVARARLKDGGLFLLHTIGNTLSAVKADPWIEKYIFPNGMIPSVKQIGEAIDGLFVMEDWHNFGPDYDRTLLAWHRNFNARWPALQAQYREKYDTRFWRMWNYYLLVCAGSFRARRNQLWQIVLSKQGRRGGYKAVR